jgi:hypothetical protein
MGMAVTARAAQNGSNGIRYGYGRIDGLGWINGWIRSFWTDKLNHHKADQQAEARTLEHFSHESVPVRDGMMGREQS